MAGELQQIKQQGPTIKNDSKQKQELSGSLVISGSSAIQPLVAAAAEEFMNENPKVEYPGKWLADPVQDYHRLLDGAVQIGNSDVFC